MKNNLYKNFFTLMVLLTTVVATLQGQTVIYQTGFETGDPTLTYAVGTINTPVLSATGGNTAPACGKFTTNGKYDGAFISTNTITFQAGKFYQLSYAYKIATCVGSVKVYRSNVGASYANATAGTLLATTTTNQVAFTTTNIIFTVPANVTQHIGFVSTMTGNGCNSANFWIDDIIITEYDYPPCGYYCTTGNATAVTSYISNVAFGSINRSSAWDGYTCTGQGTTVRRSLTYPLSVSAYNATVSQKVVAAWIDWNMDGTYADPAERVLGTTDITSAVVPVTSPQNINVTIPATAVLGTTKMRVAMVIGTTAQTVPCNTVQLADYEDYDITILPAPVNMVYSSTSVTQVTGNVNAGTTRQEVLRVNVITTGQLSAPNATQLVFTTLGTTNVGDITNARVYYTGSSTTFATTTQLGATVAVPPNDPTNMTFNFTRALSEGDNNFWIAYDVVATAPGGNVIDAKLVSTTVAGTTYTLNATPAGNRPIVASTPMTYVSSSVVQNSNPLPAGSALNDVIQIKVVTSGAINPLQVSSMTFRTNGTTNTGDIQNARVFFTGDSPVFSAATQFGATLAVPPAINTDFTMTGSVNLVAGTNYFWLAYDVKPTAACDPAQIDGLCNSIVIGGVNRIPSPSSPLGARVINCGTAYYSQGSLDMMNPSSWNTARNGSGTALGSVAALATATNSFYVQNGHSMTTSISDTISNLYLEPGSYVTASQLITLNRLYIQSFATYEQTYSQTNATIGGTFVGSFYIKRDGTWKHNNVGYLPGNSATQYFEPYSIQWFQGVGGGTFPGGTAWGTVILDIANAPNLIINANSLATIRGNLDIRRWGASTNYFYINMDNPMDIDGNLIISGGVVKGVSGFSCNASGCTCNQAASGVVVNVDGDFIMSGGQWNDFSCGSNSSTGMAMAVGGNVHISGGVIKMDTKLTSKLDLIPTTPSSTWNQTGGTVTLGNTNIKSGKTVTMIGTKIGDVGASTALTVETGGKLMCSSYPVTGSGNFSLQTGAHLGIGSAAGITASGASGNVQVSGTRSFNSGATFEYYEGLSPQSTGNFTTTTTSGTYPASVANLIINKSGSTQIVNLTSNTDVTTNLQLTSGVLNTSQAAATAPWVRIPATATVTPDGGSAASYVDGFIRRQGQTAFTFPTGDAGRWSRIAVAAPSISTEFEASYVASPFSNTTAMAAAPITILDHVSKKEYWSLNKTVVDGASTKVRLYWEDAAWSGIYKFDSLSVGRWSGSGWENSNCYVLCPGNWTTSSAERNYTGGASGSSSGSIQSNTTTQFGPFSLSSVGVLVLNPLPVQLLAFDAECSQQGDVKLGWATATERNNDYFTLERSINGTVFETVERIKGSGTSNQLSDYSFIDANASNGINYYRLSQTDYDGTTEKLKTISVRCSSPVNGMVQVYNNNQGQLVVRVEGDQNSRYQVRIYDSLGKMVMDYRFNAASGSTTEKLDIANLDKGVYYVQVHDQQQGVTNKISVQ